MNKNIAFIPARGGSKRLPRKNILPFMGKPLLLWTCEAAKDSGCFEKVVVSTEDAEIAQIAENAGYHVDQRPPHLASDTASCADACIEYLERMENNGASYDILCCLYATAPFRTAEDVREVMKLMDGDVDAVHAISSYNHPPHQMLHKDEKGFLKPAFPELITKKSQEVPEALIGNGSTYAIWVNALKKHHSFYPPRIKGHYMEPMKSVDIDTIDDFILLQTYAKMLQERESHAV